jgi:hypothetical protein
MPILSCLLVSSLPTQIVYQWGDFMNCKKLRNQRKSGMRTSYQFFIEQ